MSIRKRGVAINADTGETLLLDEGKCKAILDQFLSSLTTAQEASLKELLTMNEDLNQAYTLKDMLKQLWTYIYTELVPASFWTSG